VRTPEGLREPRTGAPRTMRFEWPAARAQHGSPSVLAAFYYGGTVHDTKMLAAEIFARVMAGRALTGYQNMNPQQLADEALATYAQAEAFMKAAAAKGDSVSAPST
jgi:hypothetical protein